ncbi:universal stress protein [Pseudaestuariivita atlantica]|uniref:Universal stress protein UspA n=1 Tax=Pseudaestuariivita atlantica TaxID=1317121 RepID=A0A0L1JQY3_9RHOB|nr:universal stress protein [Pseudaestuariivita atlantica]KNG94146.1 universal stress protein UspA [Pseudaestuariivita atlantica]
MFDTLLLAVDINDPEGTLRGAQVAVDMAKRDGSVLHVLNVVPEQGMPIVGASLAPDHDETVRNAAHKGLEDWAAAHVPQDVSAKLHVARGTVYDQILKAADRLGVGCIIVGAHSPMLKDYLIGTNAARVVRHASQSVFVVR